jgi:arylsulfatase A-like enzyme
MKNGRHLLFLVLLIAAACKAPPVSENAHESRKPNIVLLLTDDHTYEAVGALGNRVIKTPNIDRLVDSGSTFTHAYNMGGWHGAVCVASRSMIISGQSIWRAKQTEDLWKQKDSAAINQTWGRLMARNGYHTYMSGKWHVQAPVESVFDVVKHERPGMPPDSWAKDGAGRKAKEAIDKGIDADLVMPIGYNRPKDKKDNTWSPTDPSFGGFWQGGKHWSEVLKDDALDFIKDAAARNDPFFMYLAFNAPHDPRQAPAEYIDKYPLANIPLPINFLPEHPWKDSIGNSASMRDEALAPFPRTEFAVKKHIQEYYAIISHLDKQIGEILDALERSGEMDNTYIFFAADHGLSIGQHGLMGKQNLYDHSIRVPLVVVGPDIPNGKKLDQDVYVQDVMATSLDLAGIPKPTHVEFNSFLDIIKDPTKKSHYAGIYGCYMNDQRIIRKDGYKLLVFPRADKVLLFNMNNDPKEMKNLADNPQHAETVKRLFADLVRLQKDMGDELDLEAIRPKTSESY